MAVIICYNSLIFSRRRQQRFFFLLLLCVVLLCICIDVLFTNSWKYSYVNGSLFQSEIFLPPPYSENKRFITLSQQFLDGRRLGNLLFGFASLLGIAQFNNMTPALPSRFPLKKYFQTHIIEKDAFSILLSYEEYGRRSCAFDHRTRHLKSDSHDYVIQGYLQSWMYFSNITNLLRKQLTFLPKYIIPAMHFHTIVLKSHPASIRVGVHVRRSDMLDEDKLSYGYLAAPKEYFDRAMQYFRDRYKDVVFIVCTDDLIWSKEYLADDDVMFSSETDPIIDLAILSQCDHTIMSVGSFSWWAAWLANGTTIYYKSWPRQHSRLDYMVEKKQYFMPNWIPME